MNHIPKIKFELLKNIENVSSIVVCVCCVNPHFSGGKEIIFSNPTETHNRYYVDNKKSTRQKASIVRKIIRNFFFLFSVIFSEHWCGFFFFLQYLYTMGL